MVNIWNTMGKIIEQCRTLEEAERLMDDYGWEELTRTENGRDINICVLEDC